MIAGVAKAKTLPRNADVAEQLELLSDLLEIEGQPAFRVLAYRRAATRIRESGTPVAQLALDGKAKELQGIGATIQDKIVQIVDTGEIEALTKRRKTIPPEVVEFLNIPGLGPKTVRKVWQELGITTLAELKEAARAQRLRTLPGLGAKLEESVLKSVGRKKKATGPPRTLLGRALPALLAVVGVLREHPAADRVSEAGSARRRKETVRDLDIIATASDPAALTEYFTSLAWVSEVVAKGPTKATVVSHEGFRFDLRVVPPECYGNLLQHFTGSKAHNVALREDAVRRGLSVSEYGLTEVESGEIFTTQSEEELYERLGYQFIPPELRENAGELEYLLASADWMPRNLYDRVEVMFPLKDERLRDRVKHEILDSYLADKLKSRLLQKDGRYIRAWQGQGRRKPTSGPSAFSAQEFLMGLAEGKQLLDSIPLLPAPKRRRTVTAKER